MPEETASLEQRVERLLALLDDMDLDGLGKMVTDDVQGVDEISRGWTRGRSALSPTSHSSRTACQTCAHG